MKSGLCFHFKQEFYNIDLLGDSQTRYFTIKFNICSKIYSIKCCLTNEWITKKIIRTPCRSPIGITLSVSLSSLSLLWSDILNSFQHKASLFYTMVVIHERKIPMYLGVLRSKFKVTTDLQYRSLWFHILYKDMYRWSRLQQTFPLSLLHLEFLCFI